MGWGIEYNFVQIIVRNFSLKFHHNFTENFESLFLGVVIDVCFFWNFESLFLMGYGGNGRCFNVFEKGAVFGVCGRFKGDSGGFGFRKVSP